MTGLTGIPSAVGIAAIGQIPGTATNDDAAAGKVGELITSKVASGSAISVTTGTIFNLTTISLTAGDWDVEGSLGFINAGTTVSTSCDAWINNVSITLPAIGDGGVYVGATAPGAGAITQVSTGSKRYSLAATTTIYLSGLIVFSISTCTSYGIIRARRVR